MQKKYINKMRKKLTFTHAKFDVHIGKLNSMCNIKKMVKSIS